MEIIRQVTSGDLKAVIQCNTAFKENCMSMMSFRTDEADKLAFLDLCKSMEVSPSQVLRTAMKQMVETKRLPIHKQQWDENPETLEAIRELETGGGTRYPNYETMMKDLLND